MSFSDRPPSYGSGVVDPLGKYFMVGYDLTPWSWAVDLEFSASASTLAMMTFGSAEKSLATVSHIGARLLQSIKN